MSSVDQSSRAHKRTLQAKKIVVKCPHKKQNFSDERDFLHMIRNSTMSHNHIMSNIGTIVHRKIIHQGKVDHDFSDFYILYEPAEMDLREFMSGPCASSGYSNRSRFPERSEFLMNPDQLMWQAEGLAGAVDFIHHRIKLPNKRHEECAHHDLKLDNILVRRMKNGLTFMISDFGISKKQDIVDKRTAVRPSISRLAINHGNSQTPSDFRAAGAFTAPETPHHGEHVMSPSFVQKYDIFALGCILTYILAYAAAGIKCSQYCQLCSAQATSDDVTRRREMCGPRIVQSLEEALILEGKDAWFHNWREKRVKDSLLKWLQQLGNACRTEDTWVVKAVDLVKKALHQEPARRPEASEIERILDDLIEDASEFGGNPRKTPSPRVSLRRQGRPTDHEHAVADHRANLCYSQPPVAFEDASTLQVVPETAGEEQRHDTPLIFLHSPNSSGEGRTVSASSSSSAERSASDTPLEVQHCVDSVTTGAKLFQGCDGSENEPPTLVKLFKHSKSEVNSCVSPCGSYVAFWTAESVIVHRLPSIGNERWQKTIKGSTREVGDKSTGIQVKRKPWSVDCVSLNFPWLVILFENRRQFEVSNNTRS